MKNVKTLLASSVAAATIALGSAPAMAELEASATISSTYLFRGVDQGGGAALSGDLIYSAAGFYAGAWVSSTGTGEEVNLFTGWAGEFGGLGVDIGVLNYYYPSISAYDTVGQLSEAYLGLSFAGLEFYYWDNVAGKSAFTQGGFGTYGDDGYVYYSLGYSIGKFSALLGMADPDEPTGQAFDDDYTHLDLTYSFNDNLSFMVSKIIDIDDEQNSNVTGSKPGPKLFDDDIKVVVSYSIPLN